MRVLHVDDEPGLADVVAAHLERQDERFDVGTATSARAGLTRLDEGVVDCVVSDYDMPEMDGIAFLEAVRADFPDLPFVLYTGKGSEEIASEATSVGVTDYLQKEGGTGQYAVLANRIGNAVEKARAQRALEDSQQRLSLFFEESPLGAVEWNERFEFVRVNATAESILGYDEAELVGESWEAVVPESDRDAVATVVAGLLAGDGGKESVNENVRGDGERIVCEWYNRLVTDANGDVVTVFSKFQDISDRTETERELTRTTARLEVLYEHSPDMIDVLGADGRIRDANRRLHTELGYEAGELVGRPVWDIDRLVDAGDVETLLSGLTVGERSRFEGEYERRDGTTFPVEVHLLRLPLEDDRYLAISRDITERKGLETELRSTLDRYQTLVEQNLVGIYIIRDREFSYVNPRLAEIFGSTPAEMVGESPLRWIVDSDHDRVTENFRRRESGEADSLRFTVRGQRESGEEFDFEAYGGRAAVDGETVIIGALREVTDYERLQASLRDTEARFEQLLDTSPVAITVLDTDGTIRRANRRAETVLGLDESAIVGRTYEDPEWRITDEDGGPVPDEALPFSRVVGSGQPVYDVRHAIHWPDGTERYLSVNAAPLTGPNGEVTEVVTAISDLTEQRAYERTIEDQNERLVEFANIVSHDLRNPLMVAAGRLELAREDCDSDYLADIDDALDRCERLVDDLLTVAREGESAYEFQEVRLDDAAASAWRTVEAGAATLRTETESVVRADPGRLRQLLENLFRNAIEHNSTAADGVASETDGGDLTVTVGDCDGGFYVADDGVGIAPGDRERVFDAGYSTAPGGTGFGLDIVASVAGAHDWSVAVTDAEPGARFEFTGVEFV